MRDGCPCSDCLRARILELQAVLRALVEDCESIHGAFDTCPECVEDPGAAMLCPYHAAVVELERAIP